MWRELSREGGGWGLVAFTIAVPNPALSSGKTMLVQSNSFSSVETAYEGLAAIIGSNKCP